jgi:integrase
MSLSDARCRSAKPREKDYRLTDGDGMFLLVKTHGGKWWRLSYRFEGKALQISLGVYPQTSLLDARGKRDEAKRLLAKGVNPSLERQARKTAFLAPEDSFEKIAREWHKKFRPSWSESHADTIMRRLERAVFPMIGKAPIAGLKAPDILKVLRLLEERGANETARRMKIVIGQVFRYAVATGRADNDPTGALKGAIAPPVTKHMAAITDPKAAGALLRAIEAFNGSFVVQCALKFGILTFVRPGELRHAEWSEINFEKALWEIPAEKMKMNAAHIVPLSEPALKILHDLRPFTGDGKYLFPNARSPQRPMSEAAVLAALRRMGYEKSEITGHGFRAMARTLLDEELEIRTDFIEHQLAHKVVDPNGRAYNRTAHLAGRREMMEKWADYLDQLKNS